MVCENAGQGATAGSIRLPISMRPAAAVVEKHGKKKKKIVGDRSSNASGRRPSSGRLFEIARETGVYGRYCDLSQKICKAAEKRYGRPLPANVTGAIGAIALDLGLRWEITKAFALIGRTLGAVAHISEEIENPMTENINAAIKAQMVYSFDNK